MSHFRCPSLLPTRYLPHPGIRMKSETIRSSYDNLKMKTNFKTNESVLSYSMIRKKKSFHIIDSRYFCNGNCIVELLYRHFLIACTYTFVAAIFRSFCRTTAFCSVCSLECSSTLLPPPDTKSIDKCPSIVQFFSPNETFLKTQCIRSPRIFFRIQPRVNFPPTLSINSLYRTKLSY